MVLIPFLSYGFGKFESMSILEKSAYVTVAQLPTKNKFLGIAGDYVFLLSSDNKQIIMLLKSDVKQITFQKPSK